MYHVILILLIAALLALMWQLVHYSPRILSMMLPRGFTIAMGTFLLILGIFAAFLAASVLDSPGRMLRSLVFGYMGLWWILATSASMRGSHDDEAMLRRLFLMMGLLAGSLTGLLYVDDPRGVATVNLALVTFGFWVTANYLRFLDRGR